MIHTFDVFDTCVTRVYAYPRDLFFELGLRLSSQHLSNRARRRFACRFQAARIRAEKIANWRTRPRRECADIYEIYKYFRWIFHSGRSVEELVQAEVALEEESIYPIPEVVTEMNTLRMKGHRIVLVSDMYIPKRILAPILFKLGVLREGDALYVSCDFGLTKYSGKLFKHVLQSENLTGSEVLHTGDSLHGDIRMAEQCGIQTRHFTQASLNRLEKVISGSRSPRSPGNSFLAAFSRRARLAMTDERTDRELAFDGLIHGVVTPLLLSYVQWILDDAIERGIKRLYFVARDGEVLYKIANELAPPDVELRYLYGSRRAWLPPSISLDAREWRRSLIVPGTSSTPHDITSRAGLEESAQITLRDLLGMSRAQWNSQLELKSARRFVTDLLDEPRSAALLLASADQKRDQALMYFQQEGLLDEVSWALVDAGWSLNSQSALKRILASSNQSHQVPQGYYLGLARDHLSEDEAGKAFSFVKPVGSILSRRRVIVEHCFLPSTHASTRSYELEDGRAVPAFGDDVRNTDELSYALRLHEIAVRAARLVAQDTKIRDALRVFRSDTQRVAANFISNPHIEDVRAMSGFGTISDMRQESAFVEPLCRTLSLLDVWKTLSMSLSRRLAFKAPAYMWLEGSIAISPTIVKLPLKLILILDNWRHRLRPLA